MTEIEKTAEEEGPVSANLGTGATKPPKPKLHRVDPEERLPLTTHLEELRWRIIYSVAAIFIVFIPVFALSDYVLDIVMWPLPETEKLHSQSPAAIFFFFIKISFYSSVIIAMPMILYQAWEFVAPGLLNVERKYTAIFVMSGSFFFTLGAVFCYFLVLPKALDFFQDYAGDAVTNIWTIYDYTSFFFTIILAFGLAFELPIIMIFLMVLRITTYQALASKRRYAIVAAFITGAALTPQDPFTQVMLAFPLYFFYESSLLVARLFIPAEEAPAEDES